MLSRNDDGVDSEWDNSTTVTLVLNCHLGLGVWSEPGSVRFVRKIGVATEPGVRTIVSET